jgi:Tol biopolymer transport system component
LVYESGDTIRITDLAHGRTIRVTRRDGLLREPSFMPDGRQIVFTRITPQHTDVWTAPSHGGRSTALVAAAAWGVPSPEGRSIAYHRIHGSIDLSAWGPYQRGLTLIDIDGSGRRPLNGPRGWMSAPIDWSYQRPRWSSDGTMIAYDAGLPHTGSVKVVRVSDGRVIHEFEGLNPTWRGNDSLIVERAVHTAD